MRRVNPKEEGWPSNLPKHGPNFRKFGDIMSDYCTFSIDFQDDIVFNWLPFPPAMAKECEALCDVFLVHTNRRRFPPWNRAPAKNRVETDIHTNRLNTVFVEKGKKTDSTNTSKEVDIKQRSHAKLFAIIFLGFPKVGCIYFRQTLPLHFRNYKHKKSLNPAIVNPDAQDAEAHETCKVGAMLCIYVQKNKYVPIGGET